MVTGHVLAAHPVPGGVSAAVAGLVGAAASRGQRAPVFTYPPGDSSPGTRIGRLLPWRVPPAADPLVRRIIAEPDLRRLVLHGPFTPLAARAAAALQRHRPDVTVLAYPHDPYGPELFATRSAAKEAYWRAVERPYLRRVDAVAVSVPGHEAPLRARGVRTPVVVTPAGLSADDVARAGAVRAARRPPAPGAPQDWLVLGRWDVYEKGLDLLLDAFAAERSGLPGVRLRFVGPETGSRDELERLRALRGLGVADVELAGWTEDPWADVAASAAVLMPSRKEGFGLAALQGIAGGTPLLLSTDAGLATVIGDRPGVVLTVPSVPAIRHGLRVLHAHHAALAAGALDTGAEVARTLTWGSALDALEGWRRPGVRSV